MTTLPEGKEAAPATRRSEETRARAAARAGQAGSGGAAGQAGSGGGAAGQSGSGGGAIDSGADATPDAADGGVDAGPPDAAEHDAPVEADPGDAASDGPSDAGADGAADASNEGGTDAGCVSMGAPGSPIDLAGALPFSGTVASPDTSHFSVSGLSPDTIHTITMQRTQGTPMTTVPNHAQGGSVSCGFGNTTPASTVECAMLTDSSGVLEFQARPRLPEPCGAFELDVSVGGVINEGSPSNPVELTSFPANGGALFQSYYRASGLTPFAAYTFTAPAANGDVAFFLYYSDAFQGEQHLCAMNPGGNCVVSANGAGEIYVLTQAMNGDTMVTYTMMLAPGGVASQGTVGDPRDITGLLPFAGAANNGASHYLVTGLTPGAPYTVSLTGTTGIAPLALYGEGHHLPTGREHDCRDAPTPWECVARADSAGELRIDVGGFGLASYTVELAPGGIPNDGFETTGLDVTGAVPHAGSVYNTSRYRFATTPGLSYTVSLTGLSGNVSLAVDAAPSVGLCSSALPLTQDESCTAVAISDAIIIRVTSAVPGGATYQLDVQ